MNNQEFAYYGKLPSNGDFLQKNLSPLFIRNWDSWLQQVIANSRNDLSENWLNYYLTSPIWHFVLSSGSCDESSWVGIMIPSVDKVGRYFPFTLFEKITTPCNPISLLETNQQWFDEKERAALALLDERLMIDNLEHFLQSTSSLNINQTHISNSLSIENSRFPVDKGLSESLPDVLHGFIKHFYPVYSIWCTKGSDSVSPSLLTCNELPSVNQYNALLDGQWKKWGWNDSIIR